MIALPLLPALFPFAVWLIETPSRRRHVLPFLAVGVVVSAYMGLRLWQNGLTVVGLAYAQAFASLWCVYAALVSVVVLVHMVWRNPRRQPQESLAQL